MTRGSTLFLKFLIVLLGAGALTFLLWMPQVEGVNAGKTFFAVYADSFLALVYVGSVPFFVALYQALKLVGYAGRNRVVSPEAVKALRAIKVCALAFIGFVVAAEVVIMLTHGDDDAAGAFMMGLLVTVGSAVVAGIAAMLEKRVGMAV